MTTPPKATPKNDDCTRAGCAGAILLTIAVWAIIITTIWALIEWGPLPWMW